MSDHNEYLFLTPKVLGHALQILCLTFPIDTAERLLAPRYYGSGSILDMSIALSMLQHNRCSISVAGRLEGGRSGKDFITGYHVLANSQIPPEMRTNIFHILSEADFRLEGLVRKLSCIGYFGGRLLLRNACP